MIVACPKESFLGEARVALTPESAVQIQKLGHQCRVLSGAGQLAGFSDQAYADVALRSSNLRMRCTVVPM